MNKPVIQATDVKKMYRDGKLKVSVLNGINLQVERGELLGVIGASGAGKSTLLHCLGGLDKPTSGKVLIADTDINAVNERKKGELRNRYLGFVYQFHHLLTEFNALENVAMPLLIGKKPISEAKELARELLTKVGLAKRLTHRIGELSGGERQRVAIARAIVTNPVCVLADEPTGNLDHKTAEHVFDLMMQLNQELGVSFVIVTHDLSIAERMHRVVSIEDGRIV